MITTRLFLSLTGLAFLLQPYAAKADSCAPAPAGLVASYRGDDNALDTRGGNNGTPQNGATFASGFVGSAFSLDGVDDYVEIPYNASLNPGTITLEAWIKPQSIKAGSRIISKDSTATSCAPPTVVYSLEARGLQGNHADFFFTTADGAFHELVGTSVIPTGVFIHVAATYDGATARIYVNGVLENSLSASGPLKMSNAPTAIGSGGPACRASNHGQIEFDGLIDEVGLYNRALSASEIQSIASAGSAGKCQGPAAPVHGGLSATVFTVNESKGATANVADTTLRFAAQQSGRPAQLVCRVQWSTTPENEGSWDELPDGIDGHMAYDKNSDQFVLNSRSYPLQNGVYFRVISSASGYADSISNVIGGFNLASNQPHLAAPRLQVATNSSIADLYFTATQTTLPSGVALRMQATASPTDEASWTDLNNGSAGAMRASDDDAKTFLLLLNNYAAGTAPLYFRTVAAAPGYVDGLSRAQGSFSFIPDTPPTVTVQLPQGSGNGAPETPRVVVAGVLNFSATATLPDGRSLRDLWLQVDGKRLSPPFDAGSGSTKLDYSTSTIAVGDHLIDAIAIDDRGGRARAGTNPLYLRVMPPATGARAASSRDANALAASASSRKAYTCINSGGVWQDPATWKDAQGNKGVPGRDDFAIIGAATIAIANFDDVNAYAVTINGGHIVGPGLLNVFGSIMISGGAFDNRVGLSIQPGAICEVTSNAILTFAGGEVENLGTFTVHGAGSIRGLQVFTNRGVTNFKAPLAIPPGAGINASAGVRILQANHVELSGLLNGTGKLISQDGGGVISRDGAGVITHDGGSLVASGGGNVISRDGAGVISRDGAGLISNDGGGVISNDGGSLVASGAGNLVASGAGNFLPGGASRSAESRAEATETAPSGIIQSGGETDLTDVMLAGPVTLEGGVLSGSGIVAGDLTNNGAFISPGHSAGAIQIGGNYTQNSGGTLVMERGGIDPSQFDQVLSTGTMTLGGKLVVKTIDGYTPDSSDSFSPLGYGTVSGAFESVTANAQLAFNATGALASVDPSVPNPSPAKLLNIATRMRVEQGDNALIGGFIVTGNAPKKVLIRAIGPSLGAAGVADTLDDPTLELNTPTATIFNNDWRDSQESEISATGVPPSNNLEAAIVATLDPNQGYTAVVRGKDGATGVGLVEVYDLNPGDDSQLANISTRGLVQAGDNVMIGGFIVDGVEPARMLIRAIGPSLGGAGVDGALADTELDVVDGNGNTITNDDWLNTQQSEITATSVPPSDAHEAAILATLTPGAYTAVVRGKDGATGIGLVDAYNLH